MKHLARCADFQELYAYLVKVVNVFIFCKCSNFINFCGHIFVEFSKYLKRNSFILLQVQHLQKQPPEMCYAKRCSQKFHKIQRKTPVPESLFLSFNKVAGLRPASLLKKRLWHMCFPVNFVKFLRIPFFIEHIQWLLLICVQLLLFIICQVNKRGVTVSCFLNKGFLIFKISRQQGQTW